LSEEEQSGPLVNAPQDAALRVSDLRADNAARVSGLDDLFRSTLTYRRSKSYFQLMQFISRFPRYAPFNCFLLYTQNPHISYVATPGQWRHRFGRRIKPDARPLVILVPMGPVQFVYDMADSEGDPLPPELEKPFETAGNLSSRVWPLTVGNCENRDRIAIQLKILGALQAGYATQYNQKDAPVVGEKRVPCKMAVTINENLSRTDQYSTLAHELAHIHCGHLGSDSDLWWPNRRGVPKDVCEFEAESVSYMICSRLGLITKSAQYLAGYATSDVALPPISLDTVLKAAGYIESMGRRRLPQRKDQKSAKDNPEALTP
jgi:hypothetical protein